MFIQFPCGCRALEINETEVLVVYSCDEDDGRTLTPQNRRYFRRADEAVPARPQDLQKWVDNVSHDIRDAARYRDAKQVLKTLLS